MADSKMLEGKLSLVTGGGSGIGRSICQVFAREGATVIVADINESSGQDTLRELPGNNNHSSLVVNIADSASVTKLFQDIHQKYKRSPDVVINNAGIVEPPAKMVESLESDFDHVIGVNLKGTYLVTRAAIKGMLKDNISNGSVVNMSSLAGKTGVSQHSIYATSKAGIVAFTKSVAREVATNGIRCNSVLPGVIDTEFGSDFQRNQKAVAQALAPMKRVGSPCEVAEMCAVLASEKSSYMTGAVVEVAGGLFM